MKRPFFSCVTGLVLGETVAISFGLKSGIFLALLFLLTGSMLLIWRKKQSLFFIFAVAGFALFSLAKENAKPLQNEKLPQEGTIYGKIIYLTLDEEGKYTITLDNVRFILHKYKMTDNAFKKEGQEQNKTGGEKVRGRCQVYRLKAEMGKLMPGDWILCEGELTELSVPTNPGEFNSEIYNRARGISCIFFANTVQVKKKDRISIKRAAYKVKMAMEKVYQYVLKEEYAALLKAMVLGDKGELDTSQKLIYEENGVAHLLSVSGLHVSIIAGAGFRFLRKRKISCLFSCLGGFFLLIFYGSMTGFSNSVIRAILMYGIYMGAELFGTQYDMTSAMSLAGILMLLDAPWRLLEGGCQISFAAVFAIAYILPWVMEEAEKREAAEDGEIDFFIPWKKRLKSAFRSSVVISAVTLPVVLRVFYIFCPYSILINLVVIPCMVPLMVSGVVGGLAGIFLLPAWPGALPVRVLLFPAAWILRWFDLLLEYTRRLPGAVWTVGCPSFLEMMLIYLAEGLLLFFWYRKWWKAGLRTAVFLIIWIWLPHFEGRLQITMLDVGQGESILLKMPDGETVLIDGGSTSRTDVGKYVIIPALQYYGISQLDYVIVTHMDMDHKSGIEEMLEENYPIRYLVLFSGQEGEEEKSLIEKTEKTDTEICYVEQGDSILFSETILECLHPYKDFESTDQNAASLVFSLEYGRFFALFTGDLEKEGEESLCQYLSDNSEKKWQLLKVAHHGSKYSTGEEFLLHVLPEAALVSAGKGNQYGHPHKEVLDRLKQCGADVFTTMENGAIIIEVDKNSWTIAGWKSRWKKLARMGI